jgi:hypothetical protein
MPQALLLKQGDGRGPLASRHVQLLHNAGSHEPWCCARYNAPVGKVLLDSEEINLASVSYGIR